MSGYARAYRGRWDHPLFKNKQEAAVWAWMCDTARFRQHSFQTRSGLVTLARGQLLISERGIADDFGLHKNSVRRLLSTMTDARMISLNRDHAASRAGTIATIINYEQYQSDIPKPTKTEDQGETKAGTMTGPRQDQDGTTREEREEREERETEEVSPSDSSIAPVTRAPSGTVLALVPLPAIDDVEIAFAEHERMRHDLNSSARKASLDRDRRVKLAARLKEIGGLEPWREVLAQIRGSPFLRGETARGGKLVATIDWLLSATNLRKIQEGNYDDRPHSNRPRREHGASNDPAATILEARNRLLAGRSTG